MDDLWNNGLKGYKCLLIIIKNNNDELNVTISITKLYKSYKRIDSKSELLYWIYFLWKFYTKLILYIFLINVVFLKTKLHIYTWLSSQNFPVHYFFFFVLWYESWEAVAAPEDTKGIARQESATRWSCFGLGSEDKSHYNCIETY